MEALEPKIEGMILNYEANMHSILNPQDSEKVSKFLPVDKFRESDMVLSTNSYTKDFCFEIDDIDILAE